MKRLCARTVRAWAVLGVCAWGAVAANAQSPTYELDANGQWVQTGRAEPGSAEAMVAQARRQLAEDKPGEAYELIDPWIKANDRTGTEFLPEALLARGDALTASGSEYEALYDYERVIREFPGSPAFVTANERELDIAMRYVNGYKRRFIGMRILDATDEGEELLIRVQERLPGSRLAERAGIELADHYYRTRELSLAAEAYDLFLENYPQSSYRAKAMERRLYATVAKYKGPKYDRSSLVDSQVLVRRFMNLYPAQAARSGIDEALLTRLDESAAQEMYTTANWYMNRGDEAAARYVLGRLVRAHPKTGVARTALDEMTKRGWVKAAKSDDKSAAAEASSGGSGVKQ